MFVNLATRSYYSIMLSSISIDEIILFALENKQKHVCLIDKTVMYGVMEFYHKAIQHSLQPIVGISVNEKGKEIYLIAKNYSGYQQLCKISSFLAQQPDGKWQYLLNDDLILVAENINDYQLKHKFNFVDLAFHEAFFAKKEDYKKYKALLAIQQDKMFHEVTDNKKIMTKYLLTEKEAEQLFSQNQLANLEKLINLVNLKIPLNKTHHFVKFDDKQDSFKLLKEKCKQGLIAKIGDKVPKQYLERIEYELKIIHQMNFDDYFLVVQDYVNFAKKNKIMVGPGRGSAAGSLVSYVLNITNIDPIKNNLVFERFLNSVRTTMPDIDVDFMDNRRNEVVDYLFKKYGNNRVAHIITFQKIKIKTAIRDIARILDIDLKIVNLICKSLTVEAEIDLDNEIKNNKKIKTLVDSYKQLFSLARYLLGLPRQIGVHAAGVVISDKPLCEVIPTTLSAEQTLTTQYSMEYLEMNGLIKMDILGLVNLSIISDCLNLIEKHQHKKVDIDKIPLDDSKVFNMLQKGETLGIFQLEGYGMTKVVVKIKPKTIEDISIASALFRPGPQENIPAYLENKKYPQMINYINQKIKPILESTFGIIIYQEQVIQIVQEVANYPLSQADLFRRAISKKNVDKLVDIQKQFIQAAIKNKYTKEDAEKIFNYVFKFAFYGFNHSHSYAYSTISYQMAYLKCFYPLEFFTCLLTYNNGLFSKINQYISEAKKHGIIVVQPSITNSSFDFSICKGKINFGFLAIKGIGIETIKKIITARKNHQDKFNNIIDIITILAKNGIGVNTLEILTKAGCFDQLFTKEIPNRITLLQNLEGIYVSLKTYTKKYGQLKQISIKTIPTTSKTTDQDNMDQLSLIGISFSQHPIVNIKQKNKQWNQNNLASIVNNPSDLKTYQVLVRILKVRKVKTKNNVNMAWISCDDESAIVSSVMAFNNVLQSPNGQFLTDNNFLLLTISKSSQNLKIVSIDEKIKVDIGG